MKRVLWFDSVGGASGDMILASLVDLGVRPVDLNDALASLGDFHIAIEAHQHSSHGLQGTRLTVHTGENLGTHSQANHPRHRHLSDIEALIKSASLPEAVKRGSLSVFLRLAQAEASVHGTTPEAVHFHEVGA
ncbi:MAG: nickel insertion protein, partial [bacterium]